MFWQKSLTTKKERINNMAFSDLQIKVASETAVMGLQKHMASLKYFAKDLSPKIGRAHV